MTVHGNIPIHHPEDFELPKPQKEKEQPSTAAAFFKAVGEVLAIVIVCAAIVVPVRAFVAQPFIVSGGSMLPTFHNGDYLIVDQLTYQMNDPKRGDVVVFRYPNKPSEFYIKRVIAIPGDTVVFEGQLVKIINEEHPAGFVLVEEYISRPMNANDTVLLGEGEYFVMGDNRPNSSDSRMWGPLEEHFIVGKPLVRLLPFIDFGLHPGSEADQLQLEIPTKTTVENEAEETAE